MSEVFEALEQASDAVAHMEKYLNVVDSVGLLTKVSIPQHNNLILKFNFNLIKYFIMVSIHYNFVELTLNILNHVQQLFLYLYVYNPNLFLSP